MASSVILRGSLCTAKMNPCQLMRYMLKSQATKSCSRAFSIGNVLSTKETKPEVVKKDVHDLLTSPELEERRRQPVYITLAEQEDVSVTSGVPEEHIKNRTVRIYQPPKNAMQSGTDNTHFWQIDFETRERWENPLMGWTSTGDPMSNMKVDFASVEEAIEHCEKMQWKYYVQKPNVDDPKPRSYGANFSWDKRTRVSTK